MKTLKWIFLVPLAFVMSCGGSSYNEYDKDRPYGSTRGYYELEDEVDRLESYVDDLKYEIEELNNEIEELQYEVEELTIQLEDCEDW